MEKLTPVPSSSTVALTLRLWTLQSVIRISAAVNAKSLQPVIYGGRREIRKNKFTFTEEEDEKEEEKGGIGGGDQGIKKEVGEREEEKEEMSGTGPLNV